MKTKRNEKRGPAMSTIQRNLRELRKLIETTDDPCELRIAFAMATAIEWATMDTESWPSMAHEAHLLAALLREDLKQ